MNIRVDYLFIYFWQIVRMWHCCITLRASVPAAQCSNAAAFRDFKGSLPSMTDDFSRAWQWVVRSPLVENESSSLFHVLVRAHTQTATSCGELIFTANHLETITIITDGCVHSGAMGLMRAVTGAAPGASYWLLVQLSQRECWRRLHELQSGSDGGAERQTVRSLREHGGRWILCFLAVTPTGFINSLVKRGKACCGLSAFWSKCAGGCFM